MNRFRAPLLATCLAIGAVAGRAADWPMWRYDATRSAHSPEELPPTLHLHWTLQLDPRAPVWDNPLNRDLMPYDRIFEPIVVGERMFIGFNDADKLAAIDIRTGETLWTFYTDGPVRLPPAAWDGKVYCVSDDGRLYCLKANDGTLLWQFRGGPSEQKVIGNRRVISAWPARGAPVVRDGIVYFAASIWPFMGVFIYALDAETGAVKWVNDGTSAQYIKQPHGAPSFAGVAPQGALVATEKVLLVPGGRSVPAAFDRDSGELMHFLIDAGGKGNGGSFVIADEKNFFVHTRERGVRSFELTSGKKGKLVLNEPVIAPEGVYSAAAFGEDGQRLAAAESSLVWALRDEDYARFEAEEAVLDADEGRIKKTKEELTKKEKARKEAEKKAESAREAMGPGDSGRLIRAFGTDQKLKWSLPADGLGDLIKAGSRLYAAGSSNLVAIQLPEGKRKPRIAWSHPVEGRVLRLLAANGMLFAVTLEGKLLAFGETRRQSVKRIPKPERIRARPTPSPATQTVLDHVTVRGGYAFCFGLDDGVLLRELALNSTLQLNAVDPDRELVESFRREFDRARLYGTRVAVHQNDPAFYKSPPYVADLVTVGAAYASRLENPAVFRQLFDSVRPYGGFMFIRLASAGPATEEVKRWATRAGLENARFEVSEEGLLLFREGALPGSDDWTHQYGDIANTVKSDDVRVKAPLGLLWFGGNSNMDALPRHGHGPPEQVVGGLMFVEGMNSLSARDVYTGTVLWQREFEDLGTYGIYYDLSYTNSPLSTAYNQKHIPGANGRGCNYVATTNAVYLAVSNSCLVLDPVSGQTLTTILVPEDDQGRREDWAFIGVYKDVLLGGTGFAHYRRRYSDADGNVRPSIEDCSASRGLAGFDRSTGELLWRIDARHSFIHNGIVAGNDRVYLLDRLPGSAEAKLKRRGGSVPGDYRIAALDHRTGRILWQTETNIFGSWLSFSEPRDLLLQAGAKAGDRSRDEVEKGMLVYQAADGAVKWMNLERKYTGPVILHHDLIITTADSYKISSGAFSLLNGEPHLIPNPLTGQLEPWRITRAYGCNTIIASENLLTFRSGAAGYYDLENMSGTGNIGGFKSSCTSTLVIANGVLNAPDYTRTCSCPYQNQTSLALVHMPDIEMWTYSKFGHDATEGERITRVGLNFGAPGDRRSSQGTLWLDYPSVGGDSPQLGVEISGDHLSYFRRHSSQISAHQMPWIVASGVTGLRSLTVTPELRKPKEKEKEKGKDKDKDKEEDDDADKKDDKKKDGAKKDQYKGDDEPDVAAGSNGDGNKKTVAEATATEQAPVRLDREWEAVSYTVRLHFVEPEEIGPGERVFDVRLQGQPVLKALDVRAEAGSAHLGLVKEFRGIIIQENLVVDFAASSGSRLDPLLCGLELIAEPPALGK